MTDRAASIKASSSFHPDTEGGATSSPPSPDDLGLRLANMEMILRDIYRKLFMHEVPGLHGESGADPATPELLAPEPPLYYAALKEARAGNNKPLYDYLLKYKPVMASPDQIEAMRRGRRPGRSKS
jgi:hypothetical protein